MWEQRYFKGGEMKNESKFRENILEIKINKKREELNKILSDDIFNRNIAQKTSEDLDDLIIQYYNDEYERDIRIDA